MLVKARNIMADFHRIIRRKAENELASWIDRVRESLVEGVSELPVIGQPDNSALTLLYKNWFIENGFNIQKVLSCNSLGMVAKLTTYGLGVSYLPKNHFTPLLEAGELKIIDVAPKLPAVHYFAFHKRDQPPRLIEEIMSIIADVVDF